MNDEIERSSQRSTVMLNYEYARLVEQDRRREIAERVRLHRELHPDGKPARSTSSDPPAGLSPTRARSASSATR